MSKTERSKIPQLSRKFGIDPHLLDNWLTYMETSEVEKILKMRPEDLRKTARVNLLERTREEVINSLAEEDIIAKPLRSIKEGVELTDGSSKIGRSQSYLRGEIMPQGLGSLLSIEALDPKPGEFILDMAAAPGGKSCFIAERMENEGTLIANDRSRSRIKSLIANLSRHGVSNVVITNEDGFHLKTGGFDRILLDAPCTGDGLIISKNLLKKKRKLEVGYDLQKVQVSLLKVAFSLLKTGGVIVYSTCSMSTIENEYVVNTVLDISATEKINIPGRPGQQEIHPLLKNARRLIPSTHRCDGFFIVKLRKL